MMLLTALLCGLLSTSQPLFVKTNDNAGNNIEDDDFSVSTLLEKANAHLGKNLDDPLVMFGDIAVPTGLQNADPCTARGCLWNKAEDGNVYIPYRISNQFCEWCSKLFKGVGVSVNWEWIIAVNAQARAQRERDIIVRGLQSFHDSTCLRFRPQSMERDFVDIQSRSGCWSFVGRRGGGQVVSLMRNGCVFHQIVQHELLHALGFNHEQTRSDRDSHVRILLQNVIPGQEHNFRKIATINLGTPYDYNSVMHYGRFAFSRNREPTIVPIPDPNVEIGRATQMSQTDILRVNRLYQCNSKALKNKQSASGMQFL